MNRTVLGVWRGETVGAFLYGLGLFCLDMGFVYWRVRLARMLSLDRLGQLLYFSFLVRLALFLVGIALALRFFDRTGRLIVCLMALLAVPAGIPIAGRLAGHRSSREG